jgi:proline iminopeptidase
MKTFKKTVVIIGLLTCPILFCKAGPTAPVDTTYTFTTSDSIHIPVKISGKGTPCLFVPGGPGGGFRSFEQLGGHNLESFLTMIYAEQRGAGSAQTARNYSMDRMLKDIDELRASLHIDQMYLMSHSFGGIILVNYAAKYPQHVKGIILVTSILHFFDKKLLAEQTEYGYTLLGKDTVIRSNDLDSLFKMNAAIRQSLSKHHLGYKFLTDSITSILALNRVDSLYPRTNDFGYAVLSPFLSGDHKMLYPEYYQDYTGLTSGITCPALVITGTRDHAVGPDHYKSFHFPRQKTDIIEGGHLLYYEENKAFVEAVKRFVN